MAWATIRKSIDISAAHHIPNHPGKCARSHGHNYKVELFATGEVDEQTGMVVDFYEMEQHLQSVVGAYDHYDLNEMLPDMITTAENLANWWLARLYDCSHAYFRVRVWETEDSYAEADISSF